MTPEAKTEGLVSLADFTAPGLIVPELRGQDPAAVIQELSQVMQRTGRVPELLPFYNAVLNREFLISTALDYGLALPHARMNGLKNLCFAMGRCVSPVQWGPKGALPVRLVFLLAVPSTEAADYLLLIAGLSRLGKETTSLEALLGAAGIDEMMSVLSQVKLHQCRKIAAQPFRNPVHKNLPDRSPPVPF